MNPVGQVSPLSLAMADTLAQKIAAYVDPVDGGLRGAPKFPNPPIFEFLWRAGGRLGEQSYRNLVRLTLTKMSAGGIYDHLGGGYARYSTDDRWFVPHFEKMLYDNAQILELLALACRAFDDDLFKRRAYETVGWLEREMTRGGFCASLDADSEGEEGKFYVWTWDELVEILGEADANYLGGFYDATRAGNWWEHGHRVAILNQLQLQAPPNPEEEGRLAPLRQKLFAVRETRVHPGARRQDHGGLERADDRGVGQCRDRVWRAALDRSRGARLSLCRKPGLALDHAAMARAALALHEARHMEGANLAVYDYLADSIAWADAIERHHVVAQSGLVCNVGRRCPRHHSAPHAHGG